MGSSDASVAARGGVEGAGVKVGGGDGLRRFDHCSCNHGSVFEPHLRQHIGEELEAEDDIDRLFS